MKNIFVWGTQKQLHTKPLISYRVHSELLLERDRIDLAVLDLPNARFAFNSRGRFGYVQLEDGNHVLISMKTTRTNRSNISSKNRWKTLISDDIKKLQQYKSYICFLLCYDFNDLLDNSCINLLAEQASEDIEFVYIKDNFQNRYLK